MAKVHRRQKKKRDLIPFICEQLNKPQSRYLKLLLIQFCNSTNTKCVKDPSDFRVEQAEILPSMDRLASLGQDLRSACSLGWVQQVSFKVPQRWRYSELHQAGRFSFTWSFGSTHSRSDNQTWRPLIPFVFLNTHSHSTHFTFSEPCILIHIREKDQQDAHFS